MSASDGSRSLNGFVLSLLILLGILEGACGQIRYSIPEELKHGAFVGNIADDLGLNVAELSARRFRMVSSTRKQYLEVNLENGILFVNEKMDREQLCGISPTCFLNLEVVIENPLELYQAEIEIMDVNDNAPSFPRNHVRLEITESAAPGARFPLESAQDPDVSTNSLRTYRLSPNEHFLLDVQTRSERSKLAELILEKPLDREQLALHRLVLTAVDGGTPEKSGTVRITVAVLDANDNVPVFDQTVFTVRMRENAPTGTLVIQLNATDLDEGTNGRVVYSFSNHADERVRELFTVGPQSGEVRVKGVLDYEEVPVYEIFVQAKDLGPNAVAAHCNVIVEIEDENDNAPQVVLTSLSSPVPEDAPPGTVIALISVTDRDTGASGRVNCRLLGGLPFKLLPSFKKYYTLVTDGPLDREAVPEYNITVAASDGGSPSLSSNTTIAVRVSDVNDNAPRFTRPSYTVYITENNAPGASICSVTAVDPDQNQNSYLFYSLVESRIQGMSISTYVSVNSDNGNIYALRSFDYEQLKSFQIQIQAQDAGFTPLSSNTTVNVFILDQNDNGPVIVSPLARNGSVAEETVGRWAEAGALAVKVTAVDADEGQNARVSYRLLRASERGLFNLEMHTGEVRLARRFGVKDSSQQRLVVQAKDNGVPPLSATVTIVLTVVDGLVNSKPELTSEPEPHSDLTLYLIISLGSVSCLFLVAILVLALIRCQRNRTRGHASPVISCCSKPCPGRRRDSGEVYQKSNVNVQLAAGAKGTPSGSEAAGCRLPSQAYCYKVCLTPESAKSDFMFLKPYTPQNNQIEGRDARVTGRQGPMAGVASKASGEVKQQNTDYHCPPCQRHTESSSWDPEENRVQADGQPQANKRQAAVPTSSGEYRGHGVGNREGETLSGGDAWMPRYGPQYPYGDQPTGYKLNVYIPGNAPLKSGKMNPEGKTDQNKTFSTFGKKTKFTSLQDTEPDRTLS
ncbi:protocadherin-10-like [Hypanus sabinus]|uniref:protocadherin-10-like n=1 Tax=Hypanus sabinus TaxID=79690 RepID=UPI0028C3CFCE|nr:protocadherin-10-like [Hypanus sabinus]